MIKYEADDALAMLRPGEDHLVNVRMLSIVYCQCKITISIVYCQRKNGKHRFLSM